MFSRKIEQQQHLLAQEKQQRVMKTSREFVGTGNHDTDSFAKIVEGIVASANARIQRYEQFKKVVQEFWKKEGCSEPEEDQIEVAEVTDSRPRRIGQFLILPQDASPTSHRIVAVLETPHVQNELEVAMREAHEQITLSTGKVARITGASENQLRDWEAYGMIPTADRTSGGHRELPSSLLDYVIVGKHLMGVGGVNRDDITSYMQDVHRGHQQAIQESPAQL